MKKIIIVVPLVILMPFFCLSQFFKKTGKQTALQKAYNSSRFKYIPPVVVDELIVLVREDGLSRQLMDSITVRAKNRKPNVDTSLDTINLPGCSSLDVRFVKLKGELIEYFIEYQSEKVASTSDGKTKLREEEEAWGYSFNYIGRFPRVSFLSGIFLWFLGPPNYERYAIRQAPFSNDKIAKIAVLDSGLDTTIIAGYTDALQYRCAAAGEVGWNFMGNDGLFSDNNAKRHGTVVSRMIIDEFQKLDQTSKIQLIPIKVVDDNGYGDLYSFMCGLQYAVKNGATVINASLGFYSTVPNPPVVLKYLREFLPDSVYLVTAAGNREKAADNAFLKGLEASSEFDSLKDSVRNINYNYFYPAGFSDSASSVIAITTSHKSKPSISPNQNFSNTLVSASIRADRRYKFKTPYPACFRKYISGSSFATPVLAGKVAAKSASGSSQIQLYSVVEELEKFVEKGFTGEKSDVVSPIAQ